MASSRATSIARRRSLLLGGVGLVLIVASGFIAMSSGDASRSAPVLDDVPNAEPVPAGPTYEVASGQNGAASWSLLAFVSTEDELCVHVLVEGSFTRRSGGCGPTDTPASDPGGPTHFSPGYVTGIDGAYAFGAARPGVHAVRLQMANGSAVVPPMFDGPGALRGRVRFYIQASGLGADRVVAAQALDAHGVVLEERVRPEPPRELPAPPRSNAGAPPPGH
jgi:hypothetical protein